MAPAVCILNPSNGTHNCRPGGGLRWVRSPTAEHRSKHALARSSSLYLRAAPGRRKFKGLLDAADIGMLRPRWDGPFRVTACPSPNAYTLALPRKMRCSPTVNVDRLKPFIWNLALHDIIYDIISS